MTFDKENKDSLPHQAKEIILGAARDHKDPNIFHKLSLIAFFAWVGLGADGLSSSCYGPDEAFLALKGHVNLGLFVALGSVLTIFIISASYSQIVELFPSGSGGYLVATKLLNPTFGMISGCVLLIDYVLTITLSISSGADAIFSFLPASYSPYRLSFAVAGLVMLIILNLRGVKESVVSLVPIFSTFVFIQVGVIDAGVFKGSEEINKLQRQVDADLDKYVQFVQQQGYHAEGISAVGIDVVEEVSKLAPQILKRFPKAIFFGGQLVFPKEPMFSRWLHNYTVFSIQRKFYYQIVPVILLPIKTG